MPRQSFRSFRGFLLGTTVISRWNGGPPSAAFVLGNPGIDIPIRRLPADAPAEVVA